MKPESFTEGQNLYLPPDRFEDENIEDRFFPKQIVFYVSFLIIYVLISAIGALDVIDYFDTYISKHNLDYAPPLLYLALFFISIFFIFFILILVGLLRRRPLSLIGASFMTFAILGKDFLSSLSVFLDGKFTNPTFFCNALEGRLSEIFKFNLSKPHVTIIEACLMIISLYLLFNKKTLSFYKLSCPNCGSRATRKVDFWMRERRCTKCGNRWFVNSFSEILVPVKNGKWRD